MRIISGRFKGKKLLPIKNLKIRPTLDRSKEMIFNTLTSILFKKNLAFENLTILDTFCGTGALGMKQQYQEELRKLFFIDNSSDALDLVKKNIKFLELDIYSKLLNCNSLSQTLKTYMPIYFLWILHMILTNYNEVFSSLTKNNLITQDALGVIELSKKKKNFKINNYSLIKKKNYIQFMFLIFRKT